MGSPINPVALLLQSLSAKTAQGGGAPTGGNPPSGDGGEYAQAVSELKGADPGMLQREFKQMKQKAAVLMVQNLERLPNVAGYISKLIPMFDRILKEIGQAGNVSAAVRGPQPIAMGAAQPPQPDGAPAMNTF